MKNAFLLHGMSCRLNECFGNKLKKDLLSLNFSIYEPSFPLAPNITLENWTQEMDKLKAFIDQNTIFICHSLSTNFIIKYLAKNKLKVKAIIAVAGGYLTKTSVVQSGYEYLLKLVPTLQEMEYVAKHVEYKYNIFNKNDNIWSYAELENYTSALNAQRVELDYGGHFGRSSQVKELPELIDIVKKIMVVD